MAEAYVQDIPPVPFQAVRVDLVPDDRAFPDVVELNVPFLDAADVVPYAEGLMEAYDEVQRIQVVVDHSNAKDAVVVAAHGDLVVDHRVV